MVLQDIFLRLAHAGEDHDDAVEVTQHLIELDPVVAVPLSLVVIILIPVAVYAVTKRTTLATFILLFELLIVGLLTYSVLPVLSIICLTGGFLLSIAVAFGGIAHG